MVAADARDERKPERAVSDFFDSLLNALGRMFAAFVVTGPWWLTVVINAPVVAFTIVYAIRRLRRPGRPGGRHQS